MPFAYNCSFPLCLLAVAPSRKAASPSVGNDHLNPQSREKDLRSSAGLMKEMNLLLASLRRVEVRIELQTITDFLKWKNRLAEYNGGVLPMGLADEENSHLAID